LSIQDFIEMAAQNLGAEKPKVESATGGLLQMIEKQVSGGDFQELLGVLPGASSLLSKAKSGETGSPAGGGLLGGLAGAAASALGGKAGASLGVLELIGKSGLSSGDSGKLVSLFFRFLKQKGSATLVQKILGSAPELAKLAG